MKILVTGIEGYIGSVLRDVLLSDGHTVSGIDTGYYGDRDRHSSPDSSSCIHKDIRDVTPKDFYGLDAVIHLADLSNDPLGMINEEVTAEINYKGAVSLAAKAKEAGVTRYVYSSSCSVYGSHTENLATESSETSPLTMYAKCKLAVEKKVSELADDSFSPVFLRNSTVYGLSPSMRFDLVINKLTADAFLHNTITIDNGGNQWRPVIHIRDVSRAFACAVSAKKENVHNQIFNVGDSNSNFTISKIGEMIKEEFPECEIQQRGTPGADLRSYKVSFDKIHKSLPEFSCKYTVPFGIHELHEHFKQNYLSEFYFTESKFTRVKHLKNLLQNKDIDGHYFWINNNLNHLNHEYTQL